MTVTRLDTSLAVCRLAPDAEVPAWAEGGAFRSVTRTPGELSIVCEAARVPAGVRCESPWSALEVQGPLAFSLTGVVASLTGPLAQAGIPVFVISTFDTDYLLLPADRLEAGIDCLLRAGHELRP